MTDSRTLPGTGGPATTITLDSFREIRDRTLTGPLSPAAFVHGDFVDSPGTVVPGAGGVWSPSGDGLTVTASAEDGVRIGGVLVDGSARLHAAGRDGATTAFFADGTQGVVFSYDGRRFALQVWDPRAAARLAGVERFPTDPSHRVAAAVLPAEGLASVTITHHRDPTSVVVPVAAVLAFDLDGAQTLLATRGDDGGLRVHFTDATSGRESSGSGRVLDVAVDAAGAVLDFDLAVLLPCAFSDAWNCPLPPAENRLSARVAAGEARPRWEDGR